METMKEQSPDKWVTRLGAQIDGRFQNIETAIRELRAEQKASTLELRGELQASTQELRAEIQAFTQGLRGEIQASHRELRASIESMQRNMLFGFFSLAGLMLTYAGFQLS
jgi:uncharacterized protein YdhG (YjbR/CyaY superfamily)